MRRTAQIHGERGKAVGGLREIAMKVKEWTDFLIHYSSISDLPPHFNHLLYSTLIKLGSTRSNNGSPAINPPITAIAKGCCICAPNPIPRANGIKARMAPIAVINLGRMRKAMA